MPDNDVFTREYSQRLGVLKGAELQAALERFDLGLLLTASPVQGGFYGQNVFLTSTKGEYVLRGRPLFDYQFEKERFFTRLIKQETDVPVHWPYLIDQTESIFGWSYAIMPKLTGLTLTNPAVLGILAPGDRASISRALGAGLSRLHLITRSRPAAYDPLEDGLKEREFDPEQLPIGGWWDSSLTLREFLAHCVETDVISREDGTWAQSVWNLNHEALNVPFAPVFVHHDYKEANVVIKQTSSGWQLGGVFDLAEAYIGDPEEDFTQAVLTYGESRRQLAREFIRAYVQARPLRPGFEERYQLYMLRECLLIWEWGNQEDWDWIRFTSFRKWAEPLVRMDIF